MQDYAKCTARFVGTREQCEQVEVWLLAQDANTAPVRQELVTLGTRAIEETWHLRFNWPHALSMPSEHMPCFMMSGVHQVSVTWRIK
jgi:hypothetical protein